VSHSSNNLAWSGNCNIDVNECASSPCQIRAVCDESRNGTAAVSVNAYRCTCMPGYADGWCNYHFISAYTSSCRVLESNTVAGSPGNCHVDVDECISAPCANGAVCSESRTNTAVAVHAYRCACAAGYTNGACVYTVITAYTTQCNVMESSTDAAHSGNCDVDVDECISAPCANGASCEESSSTFANPGTYTCLCVAGFANGSCTSNITTNYRSMCQKATGGHCDVDIIECASNPCMNNAQCTDSTNDYVLLPNQYRCNCTAGWTGTNCMIDVNECASNPCFNGASCFESTINGTIPIGAYSCTCLDGYANGWCNYHPIVATYASLCVIGLSTQLPGGGQCNTDVDECASSPCQNGASCFDYIRNWASASIRGRNV
jgi:hypothetical protein